MKEKQNVFDRFFGVTKSGSNMKTEIMAGMGLRMAIVHAIPDCVKSAMTAGIGLFIAQTINLYLSPIQSCRQSWVLEELESCIILSIRRSG